jgi:hypothetical protein
MCVCVCVCVCVIVEVKNTNPHPYPYSRPNNFFWYPPQPPNLFVNKSDISITAIARTKMKNKYMTKIQIHILDTYLKENTSKGRFFIFIFKVRVYFACQTWADKLSSNQSSFLEEFASSFSVVFMNVTKWNIALSVCSSWRWRSVGQQSL